MEIGSSGGGVAGAQGWWDGWWGGGLVGVHSLKTFGESKIFK